MEGWPPPSSDGLPADHEHEHPLKVWPGGKIGWIAFLLGFPGGLALAALNWLRMGRRSKAAIHLAAAGIGLAVLILVPDGRVRGLATLLNLVTALYLYSQTKADVSALEAVDRPVRFVGWLSGIATSLAATALFIAVAAVPLWLTDMVDTGPTYTLSAFYGESYDRLPADQRDRLERRFETALGAGIEDQSEAEAVARVNSLTNGTPRLDDATLVEYLDIMAAALEASPTTACAAFGRAAVSGTSNPDAVRAMLGSLDAASYGRFMEITVESIEAEARAAPPARSASQAALDAMWTAFGEPFSDADNVALSAEQQGTPQPDMELCTAYRHLFQAVLVLEQTHQATFALYFVSP